MKLKKLIALVSSIAMISSFAVSSVAYAADENTNACEVSLKFTGYEKKGTATFAKVDVDLKVPETLSPYELKGADWETTFEDTYHGLTLQGLAIDIANVDGLAYVASLSTINEPVSATAASTALKLTYVNADSPTKGYSGEISKTLATLWYRITDATKVDATYNMSITNTVVGYTYWKGTSDSKTYEKGYTFNDFTVNGCTIKPEAKDPTIALDPTSATLKMGETETVKITATTENFDGTVEWTSDDKTVATVDKGVVTAVGAGEAIITATAGTATATCKITVEPADVPAPVITVKPDTAEMILGNTVELVASNDQDAKLTYTYKSSSDKIATVDVNGVVKAVGEGSATITVSAEGATSAECAINVRKATVGEDFTPTELGKKIKFIGMELLGVDSSDKYVYITKDGKETRKYDKTIGEILGGVWGEGASVDASLAIGIITADESSVFSFEIK